MVRRGWFWRLPLALALFFLPVTTFPLLSHALGGTLAAAPSAFLLALLGGLLVLRDLWQGRRWPGELLPWLAFLAAALLSTLLAFFRPVLPFKGHSYPMEAVQALLTLAVGGAVYLAAVLWPQQREDFLFWLRWLNWAGLALIVWGLLQAFVIFRLEGQYPDWMVRLHGWFSVRDLTRLTFRKRVTAWAYEPSWLAHMLNLTFFPYWLAATLTGFSAFRRRLGPISVENLLLAGGFLVLLTSFSRIGLLAFLLMLTLLLAAAVRRLSGAAARRWRRPGLRWGIPVLAFVLFAALTLGLIRLLAVHDPRLARLFTLRDFGNVYDVTSRLAFGERVVYWSLGLQLFAAHPWVGVGLGGAGFYVHDFLPAYAWRLPEIVSALVLRDFVLNVKNLWVRLLAETGLLGFTAFVSWLLVLAQGAWQLVTTRERLWRTLGWMGALSLVALLGEGFSVDTFALPYYWVSLGLLTAAVWRRREEETA